MSARISTLVGTKWLSDKLSSKGGLFRLLDGSWHLPVTGRDPRKEFQESHIAGAQFFDIDECCDKSSKYDHMLPSAETFQNYVGKLGICNRTHVVIYDNNEQFGMLSAQRVWWTFRVFGHDLVSILDGGLPQWQRDGFGVTKDVETVEEKTFSARLNASMVKSFEDVERNIDEGGFTVIDARPAGRFEGKSPEPRPGIEPGHIPKSINIPFTAILDPEKKIVKSPAELKQLFKEKGVDLDLDTPVTASCGSGVSACVLALAAHLCDKEISVYDGSWAEWYQRADKQHIITSK